jgi:hypothetical protein
MDRPITYQVFRDLFKLLGINPFEFRKLSDGKVAGYFPDLPEREPKANVEELAQVIWKESSACAS